MNNQRKPLILVTNDDGITAPGIKALVEVARTMGEVVVVAPDSPQSGMGHAITVNAPLRLNEGEYFEGLVNFSTSGTPVDCVKIAIDQVMHQRPDLIVSGINHGSNASTNVIYSGTMSAAVEGAVENIPSIGFSLLDHDYEADFEPSKPFVKKIIEQALSNDFPDHTCLNVNIPKAPLDEIKGIQVCSQATAFWENGFDKRTDPLGKPYYWLSGYFKNHDGRPDTDLVALENKYVSVVPIHFDMTAYQHMESIKGWEF